jgi:hypothetical protein
MPTPLQSNSTAATSSAGTSVSTAFVTSNILAGSTIFAAFAAAASTSSNPTSPSATCGGTSMILLASVTASSGSGATVLVAAFALNIPAAQVGTMPTVQGGWTNSATTSQLIQEIPGIVVSTTAAGFIDGGSAATKAQNSTGVQPATCNAYSTAYVGEDLIAIYGDDGGPATLGTLSTGYSVDPKNVSANSHADIGVGYKSSTGASETMSWALSGTEPAWGTILFAFKSAVIPIPLHASQAVKRAAYY